MSNLISSTRKRLSRMERGQVLVVVALSMVVIVAIVGLALDVGIMFIGNARLRRATDAAALAAALQYRQGVPTQKLRDAAIEFLVLNGVTLDPDNLPTVDTCDTMPSLCDDPQGVFLARKLVRVHVTATVDLAFLRVLTINTANISATAVSEAASVDVVLVLDRSDSMTWGDLLHPILPGNPMRDPSVCNDPTNIKFITDSDYDPSYKGYCRPFDDVKKAAVSFVEQLYFPYDRVAVVTFDKEAKGIKIDGRDFSNDREAIISTIKALTVYQGGKSDAEDPSSGIDAIYPNGNPSRWYDPDGKYWGLGCPQTDPLLQDLYPDFPSPAPCTTTNIGQGLRTAGVESFRPEALSVVILLTDGVANAGYSENGRYFCPGGPGTGGPGEPANTWTHTDIPPICNDGLPDTIHTPETSAYYDAEDYAYAMANFVSQAQRSLIFTIGLGEKVTQHSWVGGVDQGPLGEIFLQYAAFQGKGTYSHATPAELQEAFRKIAENIATRLAH